MPKKERKEEVNVDFVREVEKPVEAEMYMPPTPEAGTDATVVKQVGVGGPVPIIAPKHTTIQLQPIIVPLAVVPYMTQDSGVLRTDGKQAGGHVPNDYYGEETQFDNVAQGTRKKHKGKEKGEKRVQWQRIFAAITFVLTAFLLLPFLISYSSDSIGDLNLTDMNFIGMIEIWSELHQFFVTEPEHLVYLIVPAFTAAVLIVSLICLIVGKYKGVPIAIMSFVDVAGLLVLLVWRLVSPEYPFVAHDQAAFIIALVESILIFILSIIFNIISNRIEDEEEELSRYGKEI